MSKSQSRLRVGVVGAGRVGTVLASALAGAGHLVSGVSASSQGNLDRIDALLPGVPVLGVAEVLSGADLVLVTIPAEQLESAIEGWASLGLFRPGQLIIHTCAELGTDVFQPAARLGCIPLAIHPAMVFTGTSLDLARIRESYFAVTAPSVAIPIAEALVLEMGAEPVVVAEADRPTYAEGIEIARSFSALVVNQAIGLLESIDISPARPMLATLVRSTVESALSEGYLDLNPNQIED